MQRLKIGLLVLTLWFGNKAIQAQIQVTFYTSMGNFVAQLEDKKAPITTANFIKLVNQKFYDSMIFHRVVKNFVIQTGDPTGTGNGGPGYTIADEFDSMSNVQKTIGMANDGTPNSGGSQFYINLVNNIFLDHKYSVFGKVTTNFTVVQNIGKVAVNASDRPLTDVKLDSIRVTFAAGLIPDNNELYEVNLFPEPLKSNSVLTYYSRKEELVTMEVFNELGQLVYQQMIQANIGFNAVSLESCIKVIQGNGIYMMKLSQGQSLVSRKMILTNLN